MNYSTRDGKFFENKDDADAHEWSETCKLGITEWLAEYCMKMDDRVFNMLPILIEHGDKLRDFLADTPTTE